MRHLFSVCLCICLLAIPAAMRAADDGDAAPPAPEPQQLDITVENSKDAPAYYNIGYALSDDPQSRCEFNTMMMCPTYIRATWYTSAAQLNLAPGVTPMYGGSVNGGFRTNTTGPAGAGGYTTPTNTGTGTPEATPKISWQVEPGKYEVYLSCGSGGFAWSAPVTVQRKSSTPASVTIALAKPGSVSLTWTIDSPLYRPGNSNSSPVRYAGGGTSMLGLMRDGRVWAVASIGNGLSASFPSVQPGVYTLILQDTHERFLYIDDKVAVKSGEETKVKAIVHRADQAGMALVFYDAPCKAYYNNGWKNLVVIDEKLGIAYQCTSQAWKHDGAGVNMAQYNAMEYGGLSMRSKPQVFMEVEDYLPIKGMPATASHVTQGPVDAPVPDEDYKITQMRLLGKPGVKYTPRKDDAGDGNGQVWASHGYSR